MIFHARCAIATPTRGIVVNMTASEKLEDPAPVGGPIVLVVDDVVLVRMLIAASLRSRGFRVVEAGSGEEAVRLLDSGSPITVILTDIYMPAAEIDGFGLARWIHRRRPDIKVVVGSGVTSSVDPAEAHLFTGPVLSKPYDFDEVEKRLRAATGHTP
jgi:CheY-like chemotaxis protein